jgi:hypothetical protein
MTRGHIEHDPNELRTALADRIVGSAPWWREIWVNHKRMYGGQAPEAFLRTIAFMTYPRLLPRGIKDDLPTGQTLDLLESAFGADEVTDRLIADSFLKNFGSPFEHVVDPASRLGPQLAAELARQRAGVGLPVTSPRQDFINALAASHPPVGQVLREHLIDWDDELIPNIFMNDLVLAAIVWLSTDEGRESVASILVGLEDAWGRDYEVDELIATGFVEGLPYPGEEGAELLELLGPKLRAEYNAERPSHQIQRPGGRGFR